jgi:hypothetical protein
MSGEAVVAEDEPRQVGPCLSRLSVAMGQVSGQGVTTNDDQMEAAVAGDMAIGDLRCISGYRIVLHFHASRGM